ncbi:MAG: hypothetical protein NZ602_06775 [Thermoguttaceae bacterium]|nr:hypothetical protein [Thermoguttaceae bacterium]MDW8038293.1 hypothetical protein [Thermoguttaceae bacterium]
MNGKYLKAEDREQNAEGDFCDWNVFCVPPCLFVVQSLRSRLRLRLSRPFAQNHRRVSSLGRNVTAAQAFLRVI